MFRGVLQVEKGQSLALPPGSTVTVVLRVVGRNTKGPLATVSLPLDGVSFPAQFTVSRSDLREGLPDYVWEKDDIYLIATATTPKGKELAVGRSKSKFLAESGTHGVAYVTLER